MQRRTLAGLVGAGAVGLLAATILIDGGEPDAAPATTHAIAAGETAGRSEAQPGEPARPGEEAPPITRFVDLPSEHRPDSIQSALEGAEGWLAETWPDVPGAWLGTECSVPPCLIGLRFEPMEAGQDGEIATAWREELTRRLGWRPYGVLSVDDGSGVQYAWMFGVPEELQTVEQAERQQALVGSAAERFDSLMGRLGIDPSERNPGE
jgi:hypothetical protein